MINRRTIIAVVVLGAVLLLGAGVVYFISTSSRGSQASLPEITLPPSLADLAEQYPELAPILTDPALASIYKEFLVAYQEGGEEAAMELARQRGLLTPEEDIRVTLVLDTEDHAPLVAQLEGAGVTVVSAYRDRVNVAVPLELIEAGMQAEEPGAVFARLTELEHVIAVRLPESGIPHGSDIDGEGIGVIGADAWHEAGFTGAGLRIGVLDLGFAGYQRLLGVELPDDVAVATFGWYDEEEVHGTACAEIVHELAPDAELLLAWYDGSDAAMGEAVDWLLAQGVDIVSHSAGGLVGPRDGSEWDAQLVDDLAAQGILWVNSAGNEALSHYRGVFTDEDGDGLHEFVPGEEMLALDDYGYVEIALSWEDDWERAARDYELLLLDGTGNELAVSQDEQSGQLGQEPVEGIAYETGGEAVYAVVTAYDIDRAVTLDIFVSGADVAYPSPDHSICPPGDAVGSLTVGAANWWDDALADYSSQGPTSDDRLKPEISAPTSVSGFTYGERGFDGTSASCPHVAGAAALVWQAHPEFSRQEVVDFLLAHVVDLGAPGPDTGYGHGRLQLPSPPSAAPPTPAPAATPTSPPGPGPAAAPAPLPTPTPVAFVTPAPVSPSGAGAGLLGLTGLSLVVGALGCAGAGLLLVGGISLLILGRRAGRVQPAPQPAPTPAPYVPPPRPTPTVPAPPPEPYVPPSRPAPPPPIPSPGPHVPPSRPTPAMPRPVRCQSCGAAARPGARFCPVCGRPLAPDRRPRYCRHCGAELKEGARFCPRCGEAVE
jgi:subtilisin family serine protease